MGWGGVDLIPIRASESEQDAVDRVYSSGIQITVERGVPVVSELSPPVAIEAPEVEPDPNWIGAAAGLLEAQMPGWRTEPPLDESSPGDLQELIADHPDVPFWALITPDWLNLQRCQKGPAAPGDWSRWWEVIQRFANHGCAVFHPDTSELLDATLDETEADDRYRLL